MFDIISFGEFKMLQQALNGLAAITATDDFIDLMRVAFLIGILTFGARSLATNRFDAIPLFTGFVAYSVLFTPKVTVSVTDAYGGGVVTVANVPIGLAAPLGITSQIGRYLSSTFETAFSVISPGNAFLQNGYMEPLTVLLKMRDLSLGWANSDNAAVGDIERTLTAYVVQCVYFDLELEDGNPHEVTVEGIKKNPSTLDAIKTTFLNISVRTELPGVDPAGGTVRTCADAYNLIRATVDGTWLDTYYDNYLQSVLNVPVNPLAGTAQDRVRDALTAVLQGAFTDARSYMVNSLLANIIRRGEANYAASKNDVTSAVIRLQAVEQRNVQWASEKTLFEKIARPVTAFIEVFMVCGGPIMAFAIAAFGPTGVSTLVKFLMMHIWVCLWMPTLTICNMYLYVVIEKWINNVNATSGMDPLSYGGMDAFNTEMQQWLAVGSMLAAATPTLTLMLIWGSNQVATTLASRMRTADHVDPTVAAPPITSSAPLVQNQAGFTGNPDLWYSKTGASQNSLSYNNTLIGQEASSRSRMESAQLSAQSAQSRMFTSGISGVDKVSFTESGAMVAEGSRGKSVEAAYNAALQAGRDAGLTNEQAARFATGAVMSMGADAHGGIALGGSGGGGGAGGPGLASKFGFDISGGLGAGLRGQISKDSGLSQDQTERAVRAFQDGASKNTGVFARFNESMRHARDNSVGFTYSRETGDTASRSWQTAQSDAEQASRQHSLMEQANRVMGNSTSWTAPQLAGDLRRLLGENQWQGAVGDKYASAFHGNAGMQAKAANDIMQTPSFQNATASMSASERLATAQAVVMLTSREASNGMPQGSLFAELASLTGSDRTAAQTLPDGSALSGIAGRAAAAASVTPQAEGMVGQRANETTPGAIGGALGSYQARSRPVSAAARDAGAPGRQYQSGVPAVDAADSDNRGRVQVEHGANMNAVRATHVEALRKAHQERVGSAAGDAAVVSGMQRPMTADQVKEYEQGYDAALKSGTGTPITAETGDRYIPPTPAAVPFSGKRQPGTSRPGPGPGSEDRTGE